MESFLVGKTLINRYKIIKCTNRNIQATIFRVEDKVMRDE